MKNDLPVDDVKCEKLKSKYEYLYSSFHVSVQVNNYFSASSKILPVFEIVSRHSVICCCATLLTVV